MCYVALTPPTNDYTPRWLRPHSAVFEETEREGERESGRQRERRSARDSERERERHSVRCVYII